MPIDSKRFLRDPGRYLLESNSITWIFIRICYILPDIRWIPRDIYEIPIDIPIDID